MMNVGLVQYASVIAFFLGYVWVNGFGVAQVEPGPENKHEGIRFARTLL